MLESFFIYGNFQPGVEKGVYQLPLVILSYAVASFASYTALSMAQHLAGARNVREKRLFHWGGAFAMGAGIWSMHFIGMLSYKMRMLVEYEPWMTLLSMLIAVAVAYGVLNIVTRPQLLGRQILSGGVLLGLGICGMHYTGMAAMKMDGDLRYTPGLFLLSVLIAIAASAVALWMAFTLARYSSRYRYLFQIGAALVMGAAICGMHYTGMAASVIIPWAHCRYVPDQNFVMLAMSVAIITSFILGLALVAGIYRKTLTEFQLQNSESKLRSMIDNALDAVITMDQRGLVTEWNKQAEAIFGWFREEAVGRDLAEMIIPPAHRDAHHRGLQKFLTDGTGPILNRRIELMALHRSGNTFPVELAVTAQKLHGGSYLFTAFLRDITARRKAEESTALLAAIVESSEDAIVSKTLDGIVTSWNKGAERLFGYIAAEAIGQHISFIIPPDRIDEEKEIIANLLTGMRASHYETVRMKKDGQRIDVSLTISPVQNTTGKIIGASKIARDITDRKTGENRLKAMHQYLEDMMNHIPDPIFMKDRQHRWIDGNKAFWEMMDGPPEKFIGKSDYEFSPREEADIFRERDDQVFTSGKIGINEEFFTDSKGRRHVLSIKRKAFLNENGEQFLVGVIRDITDIKEAEMKLLRYTAEIESANKDLEDFSYIASHDLKEPLRGIYNFSQFLLEDYKDVLDEEGKNRLYLLQKLSKRLQTLIDNLLQYSRIGREEITFTKTDPGEVLGDVLELMDGDLKEKNATVTVAKDLPTVICDKVRVEEMFRNLIMNAIKYNDHESKTVEIGHTLVHEKAPGQQVFFVRDNGIGIAENHLDTIFKMFRRLHARDAYGGGTGSGLTIVRKIVDRHHGMIWAESDGKNGTTFYFTLTNGS